MKVLVCGSREWTDRNLVGTILNGLLEREILNFNRLTIIEGCARGADHWAHHFFDGPCDLHHGGHTHVEHEHYPADWVKYGKGAGPIRNQQMLDEGKPDLVVAFKDGLYDDWGGTEDMVKRSKNAGIPVWVIGHG